MSQPTDLTPEQRASVESTLKGIDELLAMRQGFNQAYRDWRQSTLEELRSAFGDEFVEDFDTKGPRQTPINRQHRVHLYRQRLHEQHRFLQELLDQAPVR